MDAILGHRPATQPPVVTDTSESATPAKDGDEEKMVGKESNPHHTKVMEEDR